MRTISSKISCAVDDYMRQLIRLETDFNIVCGILDKLIYEMSDKDREIYEKVCKSYKNNTCGVTD